MAERTFKVPPEFVSSLNKFTDEMKKFADLTNKVNTSARRVLVPPRERQAAVDHSHITSQFRQVTNLFKRFETNLTRTVFMLSQDLGPLGRMLITTVDIEGLLARLPGIGSKLAFLGAGAEVGTVARFTMIGAGTLGGIVGFGAQIVAQVIMSLIQKTFQLKDPLFRDTVLAAGLGTTVGNLRAFRATFGTLPGAAEALAASARGRFDVTSYQNLALRVVGIQRMLDNSNMTVTALRGLQDILKTLPERSVLQFAEAMGLTSMFSPELLIAARTQSAEEWTRKASAYYQRQRAWRISPEVEKSFRDFYLSWENFKLTLQTKFIQKLTEGHPSFIEALTKLSDVATKFSAAAIRMLGKFTNKVFVKAKAAIIYLIDWFRRASRALVEFANKIRAQLHLPPLGVPYVPYRYPGRARLGDYIGAPRPYRGPTISPGRARFAQRIHMPRPAPGAIPPARARVGAARPGARAAPYAPTPLTVPRTAAGAPETTRAAIAGGFRRQGGEGILNRDWARQEIESTPGLKAKVMRIAANEAGGNQEAATAIIESMINRAQVRGTNVAAQARWHQSEGGYYDQGNMGRGALENPAWRDTLERAYQRALGGSNVSNYATDNSSGAMAEREKLTGAFRFRKSVAGETFFSPGTAEAGLIPKYEQWMRSLPPARPGSMEGLTVEDIRQGLREGTIAPNQLLPAPNQSVGGSRHLLTAAQIAAGDRAGWPPPPDPSGPRPAVGGEGLRYPMSSMHLGGGLGAARPGGRSHQGLDIDAPVGTPIYAVGNGVIVRHNAHGSVENDAATLIKLDSGQYVYYMHHSLDPSLAPGSRIQAGQQLGVSGYPSAPHLHFEVWDGPPHQAGSHIVDPEKMLRLSRAPDNTMSPIVGGYPVSAQPQTQSPSISPDHILTEDLPQAPTPSGPVRHMSPDEAIATAARREGIDPKTMNIIAQIESSKNPNETTGKYKGLFQLSDAEFKALGGRGSVFDAGENARIFAYKYKIENRQLSDKLGRPVTESEAYLAHQQGVEAAYKFISKSDTSALTSRLTTEEYQQHVATQGEEEAQKWARATVWKNLTPEMKARIGNDPSRVGEITGEEFNRMWKERYRRLGGDVNRQAALAERAPPLDPKPQPVTPPPSKDEKPSPYSQWYFQNKTTNKEREDVPMPQKLKIDNTSMKDVNWEMAPTDL